MFSLKKILEWAIYLFIFLLPWQTVYVFQERFINGFKWQGGTMTILGTEIILWIIILIQLVIICKEHKISNFKFLIFKADKRKVFLVLAIWVFLAWSLISIIWSLDKQVAFLSWFHLIEALTLFFVIIINKIDIKRLFFAVVLSGVIQSLMAMWQFSSQIIYANKWLGISEHLPYQIGSYVVQNFDGRWLRAYGSFAHPNILGGFLVVCFFCALYLYLNHIKKSRIFFLALMFIISVGIFLSFSRSAWVALIFSYIFWIIMEVRIRMHEKKEIKYIYALSLALIVLVISLSIIFQPLLMSRLSGTDRLEVKSNVQRLDSINQAWQIIVHNESTGVGIGNYVPAVYRVEANLPGWSYQPAHNIYLLIWSELGGFGLVMFLIIYGLIFSYSIRNKSYISSALIMSLALIGMFDHYLWSQYVGLILWWLICSFNINLDKI